MLIVCCLQTNINPLRMVNGNMAPMTEKQLVKCKNEKRDQTFMAVIDEVSMLYPELLADISARYCTIKSTLGSASDTSPFGSIHMILIGDFFQLPPIKRLSMFTAMMKMALNKNVSTTRGKATANGVINGC